MRIVNVVEPYLFLLYANKSIVSSVRLEARISRIALNMVDERFVKVKVLYMTAAAFGNQHLFQFD
jgi:hypothetical protein